MAEASGLGYARGGQVIPGCTVTFPDSAAFTTTAYKVLATLSTSTGAPMSITIKTAQIKAGYVGQVWFEGRIVWESTPRKNALKAQRAAEKRRADRVAGLFA